MSPRLSDVQTAEVVRLAAAGMKQAELAAKFGVTQSAVSRIVSGARRGSAESTSPGAVAVALDVFLAELEPDGVGVVHAETARALAVKVDACRSSTSVAAAAALPRIVAQLQELLAVLAGRTAEEDAVAAVARILRPLA